MDFDGTVVKNKVNWEFLSLTRFLLAFIVIVGHLREYAPIGFLQGYLYLGSFEAILGFLLISGFSIGKSIAKNKENYFKRRAQRIYPVYLVCIAFQLIVVGMKPDFISIAMLLLNFVFLNQIFTSSSFVGPAWTLAVEVWMYALAPTFLKLGSKVLLYLICFSFLCFVIYTCGRSLYSWPYYSGVGYGINLFLLAFIWIAGFRLAVFPEAKKENSILIFVLFLMHLCLYIAIKMAFRYKHHELSLLIDDLPEFLGKTICLIFVYYAVIYNSRTTVFTSGLSKVANLLGNISYPLYLCHATVYKLLAKFEIHNAAIHILCAISASYVIYYIFDFYSKKRA